MTMSMLGSATTTSNTYSTATSERVPTVADLHRSELLLEQREHGLPGAAIRKFVIRDARDADVIGRLVREAVTDAAVDVQSPIGHAAVGHLPLERETLLLRDEGIGRATTYEDA